MVIPGVIEKRRHTGDYGLRSETGDGTENGQGDTVSGVVGSSVTGEPLESHPRRSAALDKVRMKGGEPATRRSESRTRRRLLNPNPPSEVGQLISEEGREESENEETPLLVQT